MRYWIEATDVRGNLVRIQYPTAKERGRVVNTIGGLRALGQVGLREPREVNEPVMVERVNSMTGERFMEEEDTPYAISPRSETYWVS